MFSRYFLALCVVAMFAFAMNVSAEETESNVEERANPAVKIVAKSIQQAVKWAAKNCIQEAAENCQHLWKNPGAALTCGKNFIEANKGRCATGK